MSRVLDATHQPSWRHPLAPDDGAAFTRLPFGLALLFGLWSLFVLTSPLYFWQSGYPQLTDFLMATLIPFVLVGFFTLIPQRIDFVLPFGLFLIWVIATNFYWYTNLPDMRFLMNSIYYIYNIMAFMTCVALWRIHTSAFIRVTKFMLLAAILLEVAVIFFGIFPGGRRQTGTFNNPNQLGYWSLLVAACYFVLKNQRPLGVFDFSVVVAIGFLVLSSLSNAAKGGFLLIIITAIVSHGVERGWIKTPIMLACLFGGLLWIPDVWVNITQTELMLNVEHRIYGLDRKVDNIAEGSRGFDRFLNYPEYLLFGAGEGGFERFRSVYHGEIHSTFGNILFSYGFAGLIMFLSFLWFIFKGVAWRHWFYFAGIVAYGMTHQGSRFTMFWIFLALVAASNWYPVSGRTGEAQRESRATNAGPRRARAAAARWRAPRRQRWRI